MIFWRDEIKVQSSDGELYYEISILFVKFWNFDNIQ